jgi:probable rRNA maturation factor
MAQKINFFAEDTDFAPKQKAVLRRWLVATIGAHGRQLGEINFVFCSDAYLHQMNLEHLAHDTLTDIITFDNGEPGGRLEADIFISVERVADNAGKFAVPFEHELHRVMVHGTLHLLGLGDKTPAQKKAMRAAEDEQLAQLARLLAGPVSPQPK